MRMQPPLPRDRQRWQGFLRCALRRASWRMCVLLLAMSLLYAFITWCELTRDGAPPGLLLPLFIIRGLSAMLAFLAALLADEAARRGWPVWRAFLVAFVSLALGVSLIQWWSGIVLGYRDWGPPGVIGYGVFDTLIVAESWALVVLVFLDRQSAARKMAAVRNIELERLELAQRVTGSQLAAAGARLDPVAVRAQLAQVRELYATAHPDADARLAALIRDLAESVRRGAGAATGNMP